MPEQERQRWRVLRRIDESTEVPMLVLAAVWIGLLIIELVQGLSPQLQTLATGIWITFIAEYLLKLTIAPKKISFIRKNALLLIALIVPAFRVFRLANAFKLLRAASGARGIQFLRVMTSLNRGMRALGRAMGRRGFGYVVALTITVAFVGGAAMHWFERSANPAAFGTFWQSVWWAAMMLTTFGSGEWPQTGEGRVLTVILGLYALSVFGYITATLASFFVERDAAAPDSDTPGIESIDNLREEISLLREELRSMRKTDQAA